MDTKYAEQLASISKLGHDYGVRLLANEVLRWALAHKSDITPQAKDALLDMIRKHIEL
jgi:thiamine monophosphate synthase